MAPQKQRAYRSEKFQELTAADLLGIPSVCDLQLDHGHVESHVCDFSVWGLMRGLLQCFGQRSRRQVGTVQRAGGSEGQGSELSRGITGFPPFPFLHLRKAAGSMDTGKLIDFLKGKSSDLCMKVRNWWVVSLQAT